MQARVHDFFTPAMLEKTDTVIPGWRTMADQRDGETLVHVVSVLTALLCCPEYLQATPDQQALAQWTVLFHDVAKDIRTVRRDPTHGFRSAAITGRALPVLGFATNGHDATQIAQWAARTHDAVTPHPETGELIQDNRQLPGIMTGIHRLFGRQTPAAWIIKAVLLHMSFDVVEDWPQTAPLADHEIQQHLDATLLPLLKIMILVDNDAWTLFDPATKQRYRAEVLGTFEHIEALVDAG